MKPHPKKNEEDKQWLRYHHEPFDEVKLKWLNTIAMRRNEIARMPNSDNQTYLSKVFQEWPLFKQSFGSVLVIEYNII